MPALNSYHVTVRYQEGFTGTVPRYVEVDGTVDVRAIDLLMIRVATKGFPIPIEALPTGGFRVNIGDSVEGHYIPPERIMWIKWELV